MEPQNFAKSKKFGAAFKKTFFLRNLLVKPFLPIVICAGKFKGLPNERAPESASLGHDLALLTNNSRTSEF